MTARLLRRQRLTQSADFDQLFKKAIRSSDGLLTVLARRNDIDVARLGMAISKKCAPRAVDRNRMKRAVRESFRTSSVWLNGLDVMVIGKRARPLPDSKRLTDSLKHHWLVLSKKCRPC